ncbi:unnamed protein product [Sphenostylis stenocarpa]|uniref:Annexin n=1 Tax=Sphenostylis stenocarpa TaxID=92480 RepID=A0AA86V547_9FABA|nr:unnamed protein product [Sphenostylis stenocarpa]
MSTLRIPPVIPSPREDAIKLHKAFKGLGCDTSKVIKILAHRNEEQRSLIQQEYETNYSELFSKRISKELHGHAKKAMTLWLHEPPVRDAKVVRKALRSTPAVDNHALTETICSRTPSQLRRLKEVYLSTYQSPLETDIENHTSGDHKKLLIAYITTPRYEGPELDPALVEEDAKELYKAGEKRMGTDEKTFIKIFSEKSSTHLTAVNSAYKTSYGHSLEKAIKKETSGSFASGLLAILRCATDPALYFAKILRKSMKGVGTQDRRLIRVVVTRTEIDMYHIKIAYYKKYGKPLTHAVRSDTSGHYRDFLLNLIAILYICIFFDGFSNHECCLTSHEVHLIGGASTDFEGSLAASASSKKVIIVAPVAKKCKEVMGSSFNYKKVCAKVDVAHIDVVVK